MRVTTLLVALIFVAAAFAQVDDQPDGELTAIQPRLHSNTTLVSCAPVKFVNTKSTCKIHARDANNKPVQVTWSDFSISALYGTIEPVSPKDPSTTASLFMFSYIVPEDDRALMDHIVVLVESSKRDAWHNIKNSPLYLDIVGTPTVLSELECEADALRWGHNITCTVTLRAKDGNITTGFGSNFDAVTAQGVPLVMSPLDPKDRTVYQFTYSAPVPTPSQLLTAEPLFGLGEEEENQDYDPSLGQEFGSGIGIYRDYIVVNMKGTNDSIVGSPFKLQLAGQPAIMSIVSFQASTPHRGVPAPVHRDVPGPVHHGVHGPVLNNNNNAPTPTRKIRQQVSLTPSRRDARLSLMDAEIQIVSLDDRGVLVPSFIKDFQILAEKGDVGELESHDGNRVWTAKYLGTGANDKVWVSMGHGMHALPVNGSPRRCGCKRIVLYDECNHKGNSVVIYPGANPFLDINVRSAKFKGTCEALLYPMPLPDQTKPILLESSSMCINQSLPVRSARVNGIMRTTSCMGAVVYSRRNYRGAASFLPKQPYPSLINSPFASSSVGSFRIIGNCAVTLYAEENFQGVQQILTASSGLVHRDFNSIRFDDGPKLLGQGEDDWDDEDEELSDDL